MSTAQAVTQHLPFLRRYARALTGSQQSGDAYVAATLEALIADPGVVSKASVAAGGALPAVHQNLEFGRCQRQIRAGDRSARCRSSSGSATSPRCPARPSCWWRWRASPRRTPPRSSMIDVATLRSAGRGIRPRARGRDRHRRADHRGRDLHRDGPRRRWSRASAIACSASPAPMRRRSRSPRRSGRA